jgi:hypothetical protein
MSGEDIVDESRAHTRNFVCSDGRSDTAAANCHAALNHSRCDSIGQRDYEIRVVVFWVQVVGTEVHDVIS